MSDINSDSYFKDLSGKSNCCGGLSLMGREWPAIFTVETNTGKEIYLIVVPWSEHIPATKREGDTRYHVIWSLKHGIEFAVMNYQGEEIYKNYDWVEPTQEEKDALMAWTVEKDYPTLFPAYYKFYGY